MSKTTEALKLALETAEAIVAANWKTWEELATPEEFERWAKSRANHMVAAIREVLAEKSKCACDSPAWCNQYKKCNREILGLPIAEPVKQEPVAWMDFHGNVKNNEEINDYIAAGWGKDKVATYSIPLYAAPVSTEAIRAEALEQAAKWFEDEEHPLQPKKVAAAIRGLK